MTSTMQNLLESLARQERELNNREHLDMQISASRYATESSRSSTSDIDVRKNMIAAGLDLIGYGRR